MRDLAVFDLDGTLIRGDTFQELALKHLKFKPEFLAMVAGRKLSIVSRRKFAGYTHQCLAHWFGQPNFTSGIVQALTNEIDAKRLAEMTRWKARGAHTLLLSASPNDYVQPLASALGFDAGEGSRWSGTEYIHLWGSRKLEFIEQTYPRESYRRVYAIADSESDLELLSAFEIGQRCEPLKR